MLDHGSAITHISALHAVVLGAVQGLTEFLPVSSSGHLRLVPWLLGWDDLTANPDLNKTFDVALHLGTFVGAAAYFGRDILRFGAAARRSLARRRIEGPDEREAWLLVVSAVPAGIVGLAGESFIERELGRIWLIAVLLIAFGLVLEVADRRPGARPEAAFSLRDALAMGLGQAFALAPGVSRSGVTISAARFLDFDRDAAARLSFLMSLPVIGGAAGSRALEVLREGGLPPGTGTAFALGTVTSALTGAAAVWGVLRLVKTRSFRPFVVYRLVAGAAVLGLLATPLR